MWCGPVLASFCFLAAAPLDQPDHWTRPAPLGPQAVDGDGIKGASPYGNTSIRLWGGNTVERGEPGWQEAKDAMQALVQGQDIACEQMGNPSLSREVARCWRIADGRDLMCEQITAGHAQIAPAWSGDFYEMCLPVED